MTAEVLSTHTPELFQKAVLRAADLLRAGEVVALPTETVYGLAANAMDAEAVGKIFQIKGRPAHNPIIVHVAGTEMAKRCVKHFPALADRIAKAFWPGPLTLVLLRGLGAPASHQRVSKSPGAGETPALPVLFIPDVVTAGGDTVGLRWPSHPFIQAVIRACEFPLAAPSANLSGRISPTNAEHVRRQLGGKIPLIVDGGQSQIGIESVVLDLTVTPPAILRPGMIHAESLAAVCGEVQSKKSNAQTRDVVLRSPGLLAKHYSPKARLLVLSWRDEVDLKSQLLNAHLSLVTCHVIAHTRIPSGEEFGGVSVIPHDADAFARALYGEWHRCDAAGASAIVVEAPPESSEWTGIADRLRRAAA